MSTRRKTGKRSKVKVEPTSTLVRILLMIAILTTITSVYVSNFDVAPQITGGAVLDIVEDNHTKTTTVQETVTETVYSNLAGSIALTLQPEEFISDTSLIEINYLNITITKPIAEYVTLDKSTGTYFVDNKTYGSGFGYGVEGVKEISPSLDVDINITTELGSYMETVTVTNAIAETILVDDSFTYEVISVMDKTGNELPLTSVSVFTRDTTLRVSTDYTANETGYGPGYISNNTLEIVLDLSEFDVQATESGNLTTSLLYNNQTLKQSTKYIEVTEIIETENGTESPIEEVVVEEELIQNITIEEPLEEVEDLVEVLPLIPEPFSVVKQNITTLRANLRSVLPAGIELANLAESNDKYDLSFELENGLSGFSIQEAREKGFVKINGLDNVSKIKHVKFIAPTQNNFVSNIFAINSLSLTNATVTLPKTTDVSAIYRCGFYDFESDECMLEWQDIDLEFEQNQTHVWFTVYGFSAYVAVTLEDVEQSSSVVADNSVDLLSTITLNCSSDTAGTLANFTLYGTFPGTWQSIETKTSSGSSDTKTFDVDLSTYLGSTTIKDSSYTWNCLVCDTDAVCNWSSSNNTLSGWNLGTYSTSKLNVSSIHLGEDDEQELSQNGANTTGLVGYWKFNEDSTDSSGNGNDGTIAGDVANATGKLNGAYSFDGTGDYVSIADDNSLDLTDLAIAAWVKVGSSNTGWRALIVKDNVNEVGTRKLFDLKTSQDGNNGVPRFTIWDGSDVLLVNADSSINDDQWHHLVAVRDAGSNLYIYIDGILNNSASDTSSGAIDSSTQTTIGAVHNTAYDAQHMIGTVDEVAIFNRVLSATEIQTIYNQQKGNYPIEATYESKIFNTGTTAIWTNLTWDEELAYGEEIDDGTFNETGLVGYWKLNEDATDSSGNGNDGSIIGDVSNVTGKINGAYNFDGTGDYIEVSDDNSLDFGTNDFSLVAWFNAKNTSYSQHPHIFSKQDPEQSTEWTLQFLNTNGNLIFRANAVSQLTDTFDYFDDNWHNVVVTRNSGTFYLYVDGSEKDSASASLTLTNSNPLRIGRRSAAYDGYFNGDIDEAMIFNRSLSSTEISNLYKRGALKLNLSTRSCNDASCDGETYDLECTSATSCDISSLTNNQYFQYKVNFETE
ncbi:MAG: LamG domain-containing protein, partial [Nanoarchaeota archaeon]|nr:LamG domain-containing protein [Nanoarchaeota archaeon]